MGLNIERAKWVEIRARTQKDSVGLSWRAAGDHEDSVAQIVQETHILVGVGLIIMDSEARQLDNALPELTLRLYGPLQWTESDEVANAEGIGPNVAQGPPICGFGVRNGGHSEAELAVCAADRVAGKSIGKRMTILNTKGSLYISYFGKQNGGNEVIGGIFRVRGNYG